MKIENTIYNVQNFSKSTLEFTNFAPKNIYIHPNERKLERF